MKRFLLVGLLTLLPSLASAQCNGVFANNTACGNISGSSNLPRPIPLTSFPANAPGGSTNQIQYNAGGGLFGGFTMSGDVATDTATGVATIQAGAVEGSMIATGAAVKASGTGTTGDLTVLTDPSINQVNSVGYNATQVPGLLPSTATVTISNGSPGVVTWTSHGLSANDTIYFCTTGALPTGLTACIPKPSGTTSPNTYLSNPALYYVVGSSITADTFTVATSIALAKAGTAVNTSSAGSGTHTAFANAMACVGCVGEYIWSTVNITSAVALTSGSAGQVWNTLSLTRGIWEVGSSTGAIRTGGTTPTITHMHASLVTGFTTIATSPYNGTVALHVTSNDPNGWIIANNPQVLRITSTTTLNATITTDFSGGTLGAYGVTWARRTK